MKTEDFIAIIPLLLLVVLTYHIFYGLFMVAGYYFRKMTGEITLLFADKMNIINLKDYDLHLRHRFRYYDKLPEKLKVKFLLRVKHFISEKSFEGREGLEVTSEMKTWVAASAVQLTFGLSKFSLSRFSKIILYPDIFYNSRNDAMHKGETNSKGIIVLSWKDLLEGYSTPNDNFNLGLHEMAHALELQLLLKDDYDSFFGNYYAKWNYIAKEEFENVESERASFFRKYAGVNKREFFAVCIEYFFESGEEFRERLPQIYYHLCLLLNQDPLYEDVVVKEVPRKSREELELTISSQQPVLVPDYAFWNLVTNFGYFAIIFATMLIKGFKDSPPLLYAAVALLIVAAAYLLYKMNKIILYENYLVIRGPFGKVKEIYELDDIVGVSIRNDRSSDSIGIFRARQGKIIKRSYACITDNDDIDSLITRLREKKIPVS